MLLRHQDSTRIVCLCLIGLNVFGLFPLMSYNLFVFLRKAHRTDFMKNRLPNVAYLINVIGMFTLVFEQSLIMMVRVLDLFFVENWVLDALFCLCWFGLFIAVSAMSYLLYFRLKFDLSKIHTNWQKELNMGSIDWYVVNSKKWGNATFLISRLSIPYFILVVTVASLGYLINDFIIVYIGKSFVIICSIIHGIYLLYNIRLLSDNYGIRQETYFLIVLLISYWIIYSTIFFCYRWIEALKEHSQTQWIVYSCFETILICLILTLKSKYPIYLYETVYKNEHRSLVYNRNSNNNSNHNENMNNIGTNISGNTTMTSNDTDTSVSSSKFNGSKMAKLFVSNSRGNGINEKKQKRLKMTLEKLLQNQVGFNLFMKHLATEFSTENLLFIVELVQVKNAYQITHGNVLILPKILIMPNRLREMKKLDITTENEQTMRVEFSMHNRKHSISHKMQTNTIEQHMMANDKMENKNDKNSKNSKNNKNKSKSKNRNKNKSKKKSNDNETENNSNTKPRSKLRSKMQKKHKNDTRQENRKKIANNEKKENFENETNNTNDTNNINNTSETNERNERNERNEIKEASKFSDNKNERENENDKDRRMGRSKKRDNGNDKWGKSITPKPSRKGAMKPGMKPIFERNHSHSQSRSRSRSRARVSKHFKNASYVPNIDSNNSKLLQFQNSLRKQAQESQQAQQAQQAQQIEHHNQMQTQQQHQHQQQLESLKLTRTQSTQSTQSIANNPSLLRLHSDSVQNNKQENENILTKWSASLKQHSIPLEYERNLTMSSTNSQECTNDRQRKLKLRRSASTNGNETGQTDDASVIVFSFLDSIKIGKIDTDGGNNITNSNGNHNGNHNGTNDNIVVNNSDSTGNNIENMHNSGNNTSVDNMSPHSVSVDHISEVFGESSIVESKNNVINGYQQHSFLQRGSKTMNTLNTVNTLNTLNTLNTMNSINTMNSSGKDTIGQIVIDIHENEAETKDTLDRHSMGQVLDNFKVDNRGHIGRKPFTYLFSENGKIVETLILPQGLPVSRLLLSHDNLFDQMNALYEKYVKQQAASEINISHGMRDVVSRFFNAFANTGPEEIKFNDSIFDFDVNATNDVNFKINNEMNHLKTNGKDKKDERLKNGNKQVRRNTNDTNDRKIHIKIDNIEIVDDNKDNKDNKDINKREDNDDSISIDDSDSENEKNMTYVRGNTPDAPDVPDVADGQEAELTQESSDHGDIINESQTQHTRTQTGTCTQTLQTGTHTNKLAKTTTISGNCDGGVGTVSQPLSLVNDPSFANGTPMMSIEWRQYLSKLNRLSFNIFDNIAYEIMQLMQDSFIRFIHTDEYHQFIKKYHGQKNE